MCVSMPLLPVFHPHHHQGKARLGAIVHQKNAAALALTAVKNEDQREFAKLVDSFKNQFNEGTRVQVGGLIDSVRGLCGCVGMCGWACVGGHVCVGMCGWAYQQWGAQGVVTGHCDRAARPTRLMWGTHGC